MVAGKNQHIFRVKALHIFDILIDRVCCTGVPFAVFIFFIRRQNSNTSDIPVQIPRNTDPNMRIQPQRLILCQYTDCINTGVDAVA